MQGVQGSAVNSDELRKPKEDYDSECAHIASVNQLSGPVNIYICNCSSCSLHILRETHFDGVEIGSCHGVKHTLERDLRDCGVHDNPRNQKHSPKEKTYAAPHFFRLHHDRIALHDQIKTRPLQIWTHRKYSKH